MSRFRIITATMSVAFLAGCGGGPTVQGFNGDSVTIETSSNRNFETDAEARRVCERAGKPRAEYLSTESEGYVFRTRRHLYACFDDGASA